MTCVHDKSANTASTAPTLPCKTHPAQRLSISLVENRSKVSGFEGVEETVVFVFFVIKDFLEEREQSLEVE